MTTNLNISRQPRTSSLAPTPTTPTTPTMVTTPRSPPPTAPPNMPLPPLPRSRGQVFSPDAAFGRSGSMPVLPEESDEDASSRRSSVQTNASTRAMYRRTPSAERYAFTNLGRDSMESIDSLYDDRSGPPVASTSAVPYNAAPTAVPRPWQPSIQRRGPQTFNAAAAPPPVPRNMESRWSDSTIESSVAPSSFERSMSATSLGDQSSFVSSRRYESGVFSSYASSIGSVPSPAPSIAPSSTRTNYSPSPSSLAGRFFTRSEGSFSYDDPETQPHPYARRNREE